MISIFALQQCVPMTQCYTIVSCVYKAYTYNATLIMLIAHVCMKISFKFSPLFLFVEKKKICASNNKVRIRFKDLVLFVKFNLLARERTQCFEFIFANKVYREIERHSRPSQRFKQLKANEWSIHVT